MNNLSYYINLLLTFFLLFGGSTSSFSQIISGLDKDSMKNRIAVASEDTGKVTSLILLGQQYHNNEPDSALIYYKRATLLANKLHYARGIILSKRNEAIVLQNTGQYEKALKENIEVLALARKYHFKKEETGILLNTGVIYESMEKYNTAAEYYHQALSLQQPAEPPSEMALTCSNLASIYTTLQQPQQAVKYAQQAIKHLGKHGSPYLRSIVFLKAGNAYASARQWEQAKFYLNQSITIAKASKNLYIQEIGLNSLGDILLNAYNKPDLSINAYKQSLTISDSIQDIKGKAYGLQGIATALFRKKMFSQAESQANEVITLCQSASGLMETEKNALLLMSDIQIALGDLKKSFLYRNKYDLLARSLAGVELQKHLQELEAKYEVAQKQSELLKQKLLIQQKNREVLKQRTWLALSITGLILLGLLIIGGYRFYTQRQLLNKKTINSLRAEQENVRLKALLDGQLDERRRVSREMHDDLGTGFTSLLFLSRSIRNHDTVTTKLIHTTQNLVQKMNEIIWALNPTQDTLDSLIAYMRLHLVEALDNAGLLYTFSISEPLPALPLDQEFRRNIYLTAKEAVHNSIKHANATIINIHINADQTLTILIEDNGSGFAADKENLLGNGLKNMKQRMAQVNGDFKISSGNGTRVILRAPLPILDA